MKSSYQGNVKHAAVASAINLPISTKVSCEISNAIRGKSVAKVIAFFDRVLEYKEAVPYKRFNSDVGHKPGKIGPGRYPQKAISAFKKLVLSAVANAKDKGLNEEALALVHVAANSGAGQWRYGRQRRRKMKATNVDVVVSEAVVKSKIITTKPKVEAKTVTDTKVEEKPKVSAESKPKVQTEEKTQVKAEKKDEKKAEVTAEEKTANTPKEKTAPKSESQTSTKPVEEKKAE